MAALTVVDDGTQHLQPAEPPRKPDLRVVRRRRRLPMVIAGFVVVLVLAAMLGAAVFHTQLAERQLEIDALGAQVEAERDRYDELRNSIASKQNPQVLATRAEELGLTRAEQPRFVEVDTWALAVQLAAAGPVTDTLAQVIVDADALDQFREIKSLSAGRP
jgi:Tfp pilus assembly protein PilN